MRNKKVIGLMIGAIIIVCIAGTLIYKSNINKNKSMAVEAKATVETVENIEPIKTAPVVEAVTEPTETAKPVVEETVTEEEETTEAKSDGVVIVEELDKDMYVIKNGNIRDGDGTNYKKIGSLEYGETIHVTGKTGKNWYRITWGDTKAYASNILLSDTKPSVPTTVTIPSTAVDPSVPSTPSDRTCPNTGLPAPDVDWTTGL